MWDKSYKKNCFPGYQTNPIIVYFPLYFYNDDSLISTHTDVPIMRGLCEEMNEEIQPKVTRAIASTQP